VEPRESQSRLDALEKVLQISRDMVATADLDELLGVIIERSMELLDSERASLFLYEPATDELITRIAHGEEEIRMPATAGIAGSVAQSREILNIPDAYADDRFNRDVDRQTGFRTRNILALPLIDYAGDLVGVLEVLNKRDGAYTDGDIRLARTLGAQAGVTLQRARLLAHYVEKQRMAQSLEIARQIQQGLLPGEPPALDGYDVAGWTGPADETGGDIFDFFEVAPGQWTLMLADATGHGVGPALMVAQARAMLRALAAPCMREHGGRMDLRAVIEHVNNLLAADLDGGRFVTCFFALLDAAGGLVRYCSAGQGPIIFYRRADDSFEELIATGLPLGIMDGADFDEQVERSLAPGDMLIVVTDGFFEAPNAAGEMFGIPRMCEAIRRDRDLPAAEIIDSLRRDVDAFTDGAPQADDLTAVIARRT